MATVLTDDYVDRDFLEEYQIRRIRRVEKRLHVLFRCSGDGRG